MTYQIDTKHSAAHFQVRHMTIAFVKGEFGNVTGTVDFDAATPETGKVDVSIETNSVYTRDPQRDGHLKTPDILDAEAHPAITFKSKKVAKSGAGYEVTGDLTLRGATQEVKLHVSSVSDEVTDPWTLRRRGVTATAQISRSAFGMGWNMELPGVGLMVSDSVDILIDLEITRQA
ncbi:MAG: YceI family protein [Acidobacteriota bacterium]